MTPALSLAATYWPAAATAVDSVEGMFETSRVQFVPSSECKTTAPAPVPAVPPTATNRSPAYFTAWRNSKVLGLVVREVQLLPLTEVRMAPVSPTATKRPLAKVTDLSDAPEPASLQVSPSVELRTRLLVPTAVKIPLP